MSVIAPQTARAIFAGLKALGISEEEDRRALFSRVTGQPSLRAMVASEHDMIAAEIRRLQGQTRPEAGQAHAKFSGTHAKKLQALWIGGWNLGLVRDRRDQALIAFVKRQTKIDHPNWVRDPALARQAIEAMKDWLRRERGVMWGNSNGYDWLTSPIARIVWAQWQHLYPSASLSDLTAFSAKVAATIGRNDRLDLVSQREWQRVSNTLGIVIRGGK